MPRIVPSRTAPCTTGRLSMMRSTWPAMTACSAGPPPRKGTCCMRAPAMLANSTEERCTIVPLPPEP